MFKCSKTCGVPHFHFSPLFSLFIVIKDGNAMPALEQPAGKANIPASLLPSVILHGARAAAAWAMRSPVLRTETFPS